MQTNSITITEETLRVWAALSFVIIVVQTRDTLVPVHWNQDQDKACNNA